jgi:hypothetical protein
MKYISTALLATASFLTGCGGSTGNNGANNAANMRGTNNNTGYVMNANAPTPSLPANATNITPPSMSNVTGNSNGKSSNSNTNANLKHK